MLLHAVAVAVAIAVVFSTLFSSALGTLSTYSLLHMPEGIQLFRVGRSTDIGTISVPSRIDRRLSTFGIARPLPTLLPTYLVVDRKLASSKGGQLYYTELRVNLQRSCEIPS